MVWYIYVMLLFVAVAIALLLAVYAWRRRATPGAAVFIWFIIAVALWSLCEVLSTLSPNEDVYWFWAVDLRYIFIASVPPLFVVFVLVYTGQTKWLTFPRLAIFFIVPAIVQAANWWGRGQGLFYKELTIVQEGPFLLSGGYVVGPAFWLHAAHSYLMAFLGIGLLARRVRRLQAPYRGQTISLLVGAFLPVIATFGDTFIQLLPHTYPMLAPLGFDAMGLVYAWALFRYQLLDIMPIARDAVVENMDDAVIVLDLQNRVVDLNPAAQRIVDATDSRVIGRSIETVFPDRRGLIERYVNVREAQTEIVVGEAEERRFYDLRISPLYQKRHQLVGRLIVLRDITARKQVEEQQLALAMERERVRILASFIEQASHAFRTPLTIINTKEYLLEHTTDPEKRRAHLAEIREQTDAIHNLVEALVTLARLDSGVSFRFQPGDLNRCLQDLCEVRQPLFAEKNVTFTFEPDANLPLLLTDAQQLSLAFAKILDNAYRYTPPGGQVVVRTYPRNGNVVIEIRDTGTGITEADLPHIFERFYRADKALSTPGFGLGLPIARKIVETHQGRIEVETVPDSGSSFRVVLPLRRTVAPEVARYENEFWAQNPSARTH